MKESIGKTIRLDRLNKLLAHMESSQHIHDQFFFGAFNKGIKEDSPIKHCGTSGCMLGELPGLDPDWAFSPVTHVTQVGEIYLQSLMILFKDAKYKKKGIRTRLAKLNWFTPALVNHFMDELEPNFGEKNILQERYQEDAREIPYFPSFCAMYYFGLTEREYHHLFMPWMQKGDYALDGDIVKALDQNAPQSQVTANLVAFIAWAEANERVYQH